MDTQLDATLAAHVDSVYRYALRITGNVEQAEELTQETMLRGWRNRRSLKDPTVAKSWLLRIATNLWTDEIRRSQRRPHQLIEPSTIPNPNPKSTPEQQESARQALAALDQLPPRQRQVMHLITIEQLSHAEVAKVLAITAAAVKANLAAARKTLRTQLKDVYKEHQGNKT